MAWAEIMTMQIAAILFGLAALGGLTIAGMRVAGIPRPPTWMALGHGAIAALGLGTLVYAAATHPLPLLALISLGCFVIAALGGATIFALFHLRQRPLPIPLIVGHGAIAVAAFVLLLMGIFQ
jgi:hypothetical protein